MDLAILKSPTMKQAKHARREAAALRPSLHFASQRRQICIITNQILFCALNFRGYKFLNFRENYKSLLEYKDKTFVTNMQKNPMQIHKIDIYYFLFQ